MPTSVNRASREPIVSPKSVNSTCSGPAPVARSNTLPSSRRDGKARVVDVGQRAQYLVEQLHNGGLDQRAVIADEGVQRSAVHQLGGDQHIGILGGPAIRASDVLANQPHRLLPDEPQHLRRTVATGGAVPRSPDSAGSPAPDRIAQREPAGQHVSGDGRRTVGRGHRSKHSIPRAAARADSRSLPYRGART